MPYVCCSFCDKPVKTFENYSSLALVQFSLSQSPFFFCLFGRLRSKLCLVFTIPIRFIQDFEIVIFIWSLLFSLSQSLWFLFSFSGRKGKKNTRVSSASLKRFISVVTNNWGKRIDVLQQYRYLLASYVQNPLLCFHMQTNAPRRVFTCINFNPSTVLTSKKF